MSAVKDTAAVSGQDVFEISSKDFVNNTCNPAQRPAYKIRKLKKYEIINKKKLV